MTSGGPGQPGLFGDLGEQPKAPGRVEPAASDKTLSDIASRIPADIRFGTSSWSFPGWGELVWKEGARPPTAAKLAREGLRAYAAHPLMGAVGLDRTYYATIDAAQFREYAAQTPDTFRFIVKADRRLVSPYLPPDAGARPTASLLWDHVHAEREVVIPAVSGLGERLGAIVFQFPPLGPAWIRQAGGPVAFADRLHDFLSSLPIGPEYAVEIRDRDLLTEAYASALADSGASHCFAVHPSMPDLSTQTSAIRGQAQRINLVRWMLNPRVGMSYNDAKSRYEPFNRLVDEDEPSRRAIVDLLRTSANTPGYVIVNNKAEGSAPLSIRRLAEEFTRIDHS
ncbi:MAG: DUF72 domain-containing protein [Phycisphaerales bacterium]